MTNFSRRNFLGTVGLATLATTAFGSSKKASTSDEPKQKLMHQVFYWLKNPDSAEDKQKLIDGLHELVTVKQIKYSHVGVPQVLGARWIDIADRHENQDRKDDQQGGVHRGAGDDCRGPGRCGRRSGMSRPAAPRAGPPTIRVAKQVVEDYPRPQGQPAAGMPAGPASQAVRRLPQFGTSGRRS